MKFLGIDYGSKKIGLAVSDTEGTFAFPHSVVKNDAQAFDKIVGVIRALHIDEVVVGESLDFHGQENPIMEQVYIFNDKLEKQTQVTTHFEEEYLTSKQARAGSATPDSPDASAAALILQSFLDRRRYNKDL